MSFSSTQRFDNLQHLSQELVRPARNPSLHPGFPRVQRILLFFCPLPCQTCAASCLCLLSSLFDVLCLLLCASTIDYETHHSPSLRSVSPRNCSGALKYHGQERIPEQQHRAVVESSGSQIAVVDVRVYDTTVRMRFRVRLRYPWKYESGVRLTLKLGGSRCDVLDRVANLDSNRGATTFWLALIVAKRICAHNYLSIIRPTITCIRLSMMALLSRNGASVEGAFGTCAL
jgi:hypothetical protein